VGGCEGASAYPPIAGYVTIYAKTTVHCSPGSSMAFIGSKVELPLIFSRSDSVRNLQGADDKLGQTLQKHCKQ
jgi:hypothetical protein